MRDESLVFVAKYPDVDFDGICETIYCLQGQQKQMWNVFYDHDTDQHVLVDLDGYGYNDAQGNDCSFDGRIHISGEIWYFEMVSGNTNGTYFAEMYLEEECGH